MKTVTTRTYETSDGQLFKDKVAAKTHEDELMVAAGVAQIAAQIDEDNQYHSDDANCSGLFGSEEVAKFILDNQNALRLALDAGSRASILRMGKDLDLDTHA